MENLLKPSFYNIVYEINGEKWLFNTFNLGLIEIDEEIEKLLHTERIKPEILSVSMQERCKELEDGGFFTQLNVDELKILRYMYNTDKHNKDYLSITILPTLECNCACYYCFERENESKTKIADSNEFAAIEQSLLSFIESKLNDTKNLNVAWFGGEPLLEFDVIETLSGKLLKLAQKYDVSYTASLTTNGYYLTEIPNVIERLNACHIESYQITLDGAPDDHNRIRGLKNGSGPTFEKMLDGIMLLYQNGLDIAVRINLSKRNINDLSVLFDILESRGLKDLKIYFGQLIDYSSKDNSEIYLNQSEYADAVEQLYCLLRKRGFRYGLEDHYPTAARACVANRIDTAIIDCYGNIYKCRSQVGEFEKRIGNVCDYENQSVDEAVREIDWLEWTPFQYKNCLECQILPLCMGGCPFRLYDNDNATPKCDEWKYNLEFFVKQKVLDMEDESL